MSNVVLVDINHNLKYKKNQKIKLLYNKDFYFSDENGNYVGNLIDYSDNENPYDVSVLESIKIPKEIPLNFIVKDMKMTKKPVPSEAYLLELDEKLEKILNKKTNKKEKNTNIREIVENVTSYVVVSIFPILAIILSILSLILNNFIN